MLLLVVFAVGILGCANDPVRDRPYLAKRAHFFSTEEVADAKVVVHGEKRERATLVFYPSRMAQSRPVKSAPEDEPCKIDFTIDWGIKGLGPFFPARRSYLAEAAAVTPMRCHAWIVESTDAPHLVLNIEVLASFITIGNVVLYDGRGKQLGYFWRLVPEFVP